MVAVSSAEMLKRMKAGQLKSVKPCVYNPASHTLRLLVVGWPLSQMIVFLVLYFRICFLQLALSLKRSAQIIGAAKIRALKQHKKAQNQYKTDTNAESTTAKVHSMKKGRVWWHGWHLFYCVSVGLKLLALFKVGVRVRQDSNALSKSIFVQ